MNMFQLGFKKTLNLVFLHPLTCQLYSHTIWCQNTQEELGKACLWTCEAHHLRPQGYYGICSFHGSTHSCWRSPWWWWDEGQSGQVMWGIRTLTFGNEERENTVRGKSEGNTKTIKSNWKTSLLKLQMSSQRKPMCLEPVLTPLCVNIR